MSKNLISVAGIAGSLLFALFIGYFGSIGGVSVGNIPLFIICGVSGFVIQWICFAPAWAFKTEHYFDLAGSLTYISMTLLVVLAIGFSNPRALLIGFLVIFWAARLGTFLYSRVRSAGEDRRFRSIKTDFLRFLMTWTLQGLWVFITFAAGLAAMTSQTSVPLGIFAMIGAALWITGFVIEVVADRQKSRFRQDPANQNDFIKTGLWAWSRHPNYFGEILLWTGIAVIAYPVLIGWQQLTLISPFFVIALLTGLSGIPMLEARAEKQWGDSPTYQDYKRRTPVLLMMPPSNHGV